MPAAPARVGHVDAGRRGTTESAGLVAAGVGDPEGDQVGVCGVDVRTRTGVDQADTQRYRAADRFGDVRAGPGMRARPARDRLMAGWVGRVV
ncbi:hypothetical protein AAY23_10592 [Frankia casuarinae]|nr:hypothetical protein BMG523Draft_00297 [Frankia sp. BMG5.23]KEZ36623.1 hypothetical protein CEDDRAFT_01977 [Frankia sp. CeD]OAA22843.1 hypothetical protein AAY23_10592 [Frankia casuarinae]